MNLSKYRALIAERTKKVEFPISDEELYDRYEHVFTAAVNDVMREDGLLNQALPYYIKPLNDNDIACGAAFTIKGCQGLDFDEDKEMEERAKMLDGIYPGCFVVWDTTEDTSCAHYGGMMAKASKKRGCRGAVVDGGIRDTTSIKQENFPLYYRYRSSNAMMCRYRITDWECPIEIGGVRVYPGDIIFADADGVLVVPRPIAYDVLLRAEAIRDKEVGVAEMINDGMQPTEVVENGGYF